MTLAKCLDLMSQLPVCSIPATAVPVLRGCDLDDTRLAGEVAAEGAGHTTVNIQAAQQRREKDDEKDAEYTTGSRTQQEGDAAARILASPVCRRFQ